MRQSRSPSGFASPDPGASARRLLERLSEAECMELPANGGVGHLACTSRNGPTALPVTYKIDGGRLSWAHGIPPSLTRTCVLVSRRPSIRGPPGRLEHHGRYFTGPGPLRGGLGRGQPRPSRSSASPRRCPHHRPERPAHWHRVRSWTRRCRSGGPGSRRRCVPARPVRAAGGLPGCGSGCGGRSSP
jgi:hypothetical protein